MKTNYITQRLAEIQMQEEIMLCIVTNIRSVKFNKSD